MMISESYRWFLCCFTLDISSFLYKITWFISLFDYVCSHFLHQRMQNSWSRHYLNLQLPFLFCSQWFQLLSLSGSINDFLWKVKHPLCKKKATLNPPKMEIAIILYSLIAEKHHVWWEKRVDVTFCNLHLRLSLSIITFNYNFEQNSNTTIYLTITGLGFVISCMTKIKITL